MFKELEVISEVLSYRSSWNSFFESNFSELNSKVLDLNKARPKIALAGYAPTIFSKMFKREMSEDANFMFSIFNLMLGYIDDLVDDSKSYTELRCVLRKAETFFDTGNGFDELSTLRNYLVQNFPVNNLDSFIDNIRCSGESAIYEAWAKEPKDLQHSREMIGVCYTDILTSVMDAYSVTELNDTEKKIIKNYTVGCTFLDNLSDVYQDRALGTLTMAVVELEKGMFFPFLKEEYSRINAEYFRPARRRLKFLDNGDLGRFKAIESLAKTYYLSSFLKKMKTY